MTIKITVKNLTNGSTIRVEVEPSDTVSEIIESAAEFWKLKEGAYVLKKGKKLLRGSELVSEIGLMNEDVLELIPDPEGGCRWDFRGRSF
jgi:hypothetical protein